MILFTKDNKNKPYLIFKNLYKKAVDNKQQYIQSAVISSYSYNLKEVDSRYVNIKQIDDENFIFYSNYNSSKAKQFQEHSQISAVFFWNSINVQIRVKAFIQKISKSDSEHYFFNRNHKKNALAISSFQSTPTESYSLVEKNYNKVLKKNDLSRCPEYWGGYSFKPYYFEFWEGHESRINKREVFNNIDGIWKHSLLQP